MNATSSDNMILLTIFRWMEPVHGEPGINEDMQQVLKVKAVSEPDKYRDVCLVLDARAIQRQIVYNPPLKKITGFVSDGLP